MKRRERSVLIAASTALFTGCGSNAGSQDAAVPNTPAPPTTTTAAADPLVGGWRQDFSCEDNVETFHRLVLIDYDEATYRKWVRSDVAWGPNSETATELTPEALCEGAPDRYKIMKVEDGYISLFGFPTGTAWHPAR